MTPKSAIFLWGIRASTEYKYMVHAKQHLDPLICFCRSHGVLSLYCLRDAPKSDHFHYRSSAVCVLVCVSVHLLVTTMSLTET